jgi:hypothetical protein
MKGLAFHLRSHGLLAYDESTRWDISGSLILVSDIGSFVVSTSTTKVRWRCFFSSWPTSDDALLAAIG